MNSISTKSWLSNWLNWSPINRQDRTEETAFSFSNLPIHISLAAVHRDDFGGHTAHTGIVRHIVCDQREASCLMQTRRSEMFLNRLVIGNQIILLNVICNQYPPLVMPHRYQPIDAEDERKNKPEVEGVEWHYISVLAFTKSSTIQPQKSNPAPSCHCISEVQ